MIRLDKIRLIGLLVLFLFISSCSNIPVIEKECPTDIIPDRLPLKCRQTEFYDYQECKPPETYYLIGNHAYTLKEDLWEWADGSPIISQKYYLCQTGHEEGENINYIYCKGGRNYELIWSKTEISEEGIIQPEEKYYVSLVLDYGDYIDEEQLVYEPSDESKTTNIKISKYKVLDYSCR